MSESIRSFIAVPVPEEVKSRVALQTEALKGSTRGVRWTKMGSWHLTLHFLGEILPSDVELLGELITNAVEGEPAFQMELSQLGVFPESGPARVIWMGPSGPVTQLQRIHLTLGQGLHARGLRTDRRPFHPHLTLGRIRSRREGVGAARAVAQAIPESTGSFTVDRIVLYKSDLRPTGAVYEEIASAGLRPVGGAEHVESKG